MDQFNMNLGKNLMSDSKFYVGYSRWNPEAARYETWHEAVDRVMAMHESKYTQQLAKSPALRKYFAEAAKAYTHKKVLGAQRALQFGGTQLRKHEAKMYNCSSSHVDRPRFFSEAMYLLLCGCGVGFSVQRRHIDQLPAVAARSKKRVKVFTIPDTIEGWADAFGVLLSSYFIAHQQFPEYAGVQVHFDFSEIRPRGSLISGGFKAPGPEGLRKALLACETLIERELAAGEGAHAGVKLRPIVAYDFVMHMADAVLSGGVRRSATICLFDKDDEDMLNAKTGNWFDTNPQRGRSNNSVVLKRNVLLREEWAHIMRSVRYFGEPGFVFVDDYDTTFNPCVEIGMLPIAEDGESGFQFCNLTEINGAECTTPEAFYEACRAGAILGTIQAGYTDFKYVTDATRRITEREALIGVGITGWMNNPHVLFDEAVLAKGAAIVKEVNAKVAKLLGIRQAARTTCVKPSGNASVLLGTGSGIHGEHAARYFRNVQLNVEDEVAKLLMALNPKMVEKSVWDNNGRDIVVSFPVVTEETAIFKADLMGIKQLEFVRKAQQHWVNAGTNVELCRLPSLRHNVSNTISVDDWDEVEQYIYDNREWFAGISLLAAAGDKAYAQAPFTEVLTSEQILAQYGDASLFASGLIVDGLHAFNDDLWQACSTALDASTKLSDDSKDLLKRDWVRRFDKFAENFFGGNPEKASCCLKDCHNLHKWVTIQRTMKDINFAAELTSRRAEVDADTLASQACAGGVCELSF